MARYTVKGTVDEKRIDIVKKKLAEAFGEDAFTVEKEKVATSRAERFGEAESLVGDAASILQELGEEMRSWHDNMPESLQGSDRGTRVEEAADALEELASELEGLDWSVEFPGMYD